MSSKAQYLSYPDVIRTLNEKEISHDLSAACSQSALSTLDLLARFDHVASLLHAIDLAEASAATAATPIKPGWLNIRKGYRDLIWQLRGSTSSVAARLKIFHATVLPCLAGARSSDGSGMVVLKSFSQISSEFVNISRHVAENIMRIHAMLAKFNETFMKFSSSKTAAASTGLTPKYDLKELAAKISTLELCSRQLCMMNAKLLSPDVSHLAYCALRTIAYSGKKGKSKMTYDRLALRGPELQELGKVEQTLEHTRNELAHAQYTAQLSWHAMQADTITSAAKAISELVPDTIMAVESLLCLVFAIWWRLQIDCAELFRWMVQADQRLETPVVITTYQTTSTSVYQPLATALESFVACLDPTRFQKEAC